MGLVKLFHLIAIVHFGFGFWYDQKFITEPDNKHRGFSFGGRMIYLTIWNLTFQFIYFTISLLNDLIGSNEASPKKSPFIRKIRDYFFATLAFPFAFNVGLLFWVLMYIDRELVMPKAIDAFFPFWLNHLVHTNIMIFVAIELFALPRNYPSRKAAMAGMTVLMAVYLGWIFCIRANTGGKWVYPILNVLEWPERIGFFAFTFSIPIILYFVGEFLNKITWGSAIKEKQTPKKKKQKTK